MLSKPIARKSRPAAWTVGLAGWFVILAAAFYVGLSILPEGQTELGQLGWWLSGVVAMVLLKRVVLWTVYQPVAAATDDHQLPSVTVIIPAFNEGEMVRRAIDSVLACSYPEHRLRVIVVNDGSTDDTRHHIDEAVKAHRASQRLSAVHLDRNEGKRGALYVGFQAARSDIVATVDSDTIVRPMAVRALVAPFVRSPHVGGVAGRVLVHNRFENVLTRMLGVRYILGFDFIRAYQSVLGNVWCCPGAIQAYRREVIAPHLDTWRDQRFLGAACTNGDDHAMTNLVLSKGFDTKYQQNAEVETLAPTRYLGLCKMYVRWGRSATREGVRALRFVHRRCAQLGPLRGPLVLLDGLLQPAAIAARIGAVAAVFMVLLTEPEGMLHVIGGVLGSAVLYGLVYLRSERSREVFFGILYGFFALVCLPWIQPFATLTVRRNGWLTRR